jgi:Domain of unknown function (DUF3850)
VRHMLKCAQVPFDAMWRGLKRHEVRSTVDRTFREGDELLLRELRGLDPLEYTGRAMLVVVTYVTAGATWGVAGRPVRDERRGGGARAGLPARRLRGQKRPVPPTRGAAC